MVYVTYEIKITGNYLTHDAQTKKEAVNLAILHLRAELNRWYDKKGNKMIEEMV